MFSVLNFHEAKRNQELDIKTMFLIPGKLEASVPVPIKCDRYEFITASPAHPRCCFLENADSNGFHEDLDYEALPPLTFTKFDFGKKSWYKYVYAKASQWIDCDSEHPVLRRTSIKLWIMLNVHQRSEKNLDEKHSWHSFHRIGIICDYSSRLGVALKFDRTTSPLSSDSTMIDRWLGEPVRCLVYDAEIFETSNENKPILSADMEKIASKFFHLPNVYALIYGGGEKLKLKTVPKEFAPYIAYLDALYQETCKTMKEVEYCPGDVLYAPAAPLTETLSYSTYEEYESDYVKYDSYFRAVKSSLYRLFKCSSDIKDHGKKRNIMVLGAGRGPLVTACLNAVHDVGLKVKVYAVEKNFSAIVLLKYLASTKWKENDVEIVHSFMKDFRPKSDEKADIIVSELLGSFGDNELSPECLDEASHLAKDHCIYIPHSYTSFLAPVHSYKLRTAVNSLANATQHPTNIFENSYVVRLENCFLPAEPQPLFAFSHPNKCNKSPDRFNELKFIVTESCELVGLAGYFTAYLFENEISISIEPSKVTRGMFSWSPLFFPFSNPIYAEKGTEIVIDFWRSSDSSKVWYEWCMVKPVQTSIMNVKGRSCSMYKF